MMDYSSQVSFLTRYIRDGHVHRVGTWTRGSRFGAIWCGLAYGYKIRFDTEGQNLVAGSFRVEYVGKENMEALRA